MNSTNIYRCRICGKFTEKIIHCSTPTTLFIDRYRREKLSRLLSGLLRHFPWEAGLSLDEEGFVSLYELAEAIKHKWKGGNYSWVTEEHIFVVAKLDPKGRFEVIGDRIRARYGHSIHVDIKYEKTFYPHPLYHGTIEEKLKSIMKEGLKPLRRRYVHLTSNISDAWTRAETRHGTPIVLVIDGRYLSEKRLLYKASDTVFLAPYVTPEAIVRVLRKK